MSATRLYAYSRPPPDPPLPLLVTGVAGVAGYNAFYYFRARYGDRVVGMRRLDNRLLADDGIEGCDVDRREAVRRLFETYRFAAVLNCEGTCKLKSCELDPPMAWRINVLGAMNLAETAREWNARLVHYSIDLVFSGTGGGAYDESARPDPVTVYGKTMAQSERIILNERAESCVLRISLPMGESFNGHAGAIDWIQSRFRQGKPATLYYDEIRTPTYTDCLNRVAHAVLASDLRGLFHAGGPRPLTLYQIAQIVNRLGGYDPGLLEGCLRRDAGPIPPRAGNVSMNSERLGEALGYEPFAPWPLDDRWAPDGERWHAARTGPEGSPARIAERLYRNPLLDQLGLARERVGPRRRHARH
ncbi:MAG: sugar nucleotide-binding protein [Planctomycetes bacterium]|nr:sugar nucleotide-binding protein [Planctomycetota bacterium]